ncbi:MAG: glycosyltransferase family 4 protein [Candidatus Rokuibacteriota bacterium]
MRILFLTYSYERGLVGDVGGFRKLWELAHALDRRGVDVLVLYPDLPGQRALAPVPSRAYAVIDRPWLRPATAYLSMVAAAWRVARRNGPDVAYFRSSRTVLPLLLRWRRGTRVVLEINADALEYQRVEGGGGLGRALTRWTETLNVRFADRVIALTPGLKDMVVARYGASAAKVVVVPSATDPGHFRPLEPAEARRRIGLDPARPVVGFVGIFYRHQGVPTLLEGLARLRAAGPPVTGLIVGDGVMRQQWQALARRLGLEKAVRFTGQVSYADVPLYFNAMDVVAAPFTADRGETSPFKVLDALACARPVVASDIPSVRTLAAETGAVVLVPPGDAETLAKTLQGLLDDAPGRQALGAEGRALVLARYTWDRIAEAVARGLATP